MIRHALVRRAGPIGAGGLGLLLIVLTAGTSRAGGPAAPEPPPSPRYVAEDMALVAESVLPSGWALLAEDATRPEAEGALAAAVADAATAAKIPAASVSCVLRSMAGPAGKAATIALVDADEGTSLVAGALKATATKRGWTIREMGAPSRLLLGAAPAVAPTVRDALVAAQVAWAAEGLAKRARAVLETHDPQGCLAVASVALALAPTSAHAHMMAQDVIFAVAYLKNAHGPFDAAVLHVRAALASTASAAYPLTAAEALAARAQLAFLLLLGSGGEAEARDLLLEIVKHPDLAGRDHWNHRYNLACAQARLGEKDAAFVVLSAVLARDAEETVFGIEGWREDEDFKRLRDDPRFKALLEKYPAPDSGK